jgi:hypothetical protein
MRRFNFGILLSWHQSILARDARRSPEVSRSLSAAKWGTRERRLLVVVAPDSKAFDTKQRTRSAFGSFSRTLQDDGRNGVEISRGNIQLDKQRRQRNSKKISESSHRPSGNLMKPFEAQLACCTENSGVHGAYIFSTSGRKEEVGANYARFGIKKKKVFLPPSSLNSPQKGLVLHEFHQKSII